MKSFEKRTALINDSAFIFHFITVIILFFIKFFYTISAVLFFALNIITFFFYTISVVFFVALKVTIFFFYIISAVLFSTLLLFMLLKLFNYFYILFRLISFMSTSRGNLSLPRSRGIYQASYINKSGCRSNRS